MHVNLFVRLVQLFCLVAVTQGAGSAPVRNGDELAWRCLVAITDTRDGPTTAGQSTAGWRFWTTRGELFPGRGEPEPTHSAFTHYRPVELTQPNLIAEVEQLNNTRSHGFSNTLGPGTRLSETIYLNPAVAQVVLEHKLYTREGLISYVFKEQHGRFVLPSDAREIKTEWKALQDSDNPNDYFIGTDKAGSRYGLVALHLQSHELPNSLWATWIHQSYLPALKNYPVTDAFGGTDSNFPSSRLKKLLTDHAQLTWLKYRLIGTQVDFANRASLGNPLIEGPVFPGDLKAASCISCHAQAAIDKFGHWSFRKAPVGKIVPPIAGRARLDFDFTLVIAPVCQQGIGTDCTETFSQLF